MKVTSLDIHKQYGILTDEVCKLTLQYEMNTNIEPIICIIYIKITYAYAKLSNNINAHCSVVGMTWKIDKTRA